VFGFASFPAMPGLLHLLEILETTLELPNVKLGISAELQNNPHTRLRGKLD